MNQCSRPTRSRDPLKAPAIVAAVVAAVAVLPAVAGEERPATAPPTEKNAYGAPAGTGISMPPYYQPTPSVKNRNVYLPSTEPLGADEMRITFMGSQPWPPRIAQACR